MKILSIRRAIIFLMAAAAIVLTGSGIATAAPYGTSSPQLGVLDPGPCSGAYVTAQGQGFQAGETVAVFRDGQSVGSVVAGSDGTFSDRIDLTSTTPGSHTVSATGAVTNISASGGFTVQAQSCDGGQSNVVTASGNSTGSLAFTGTEVASLGIVAVIALAGGILLVLLGRRRKA
jgi:hypothetical protein